MQRFIKVTDKNYDTFRYINIDQIIAMWFNSPGTLIRCTHDISIYAKETPEEIMEMING